MLNVELRDVVLDCLACLTRAVGPADEIILVDNASTEDSVAAVRLASPDVRIVENAENRYILGAERRLAQARRRSACGVSPCGKPDQCSVFTSVELRTFVRQNELSTVWNDVDDPVVLLQHAGWLGPRLVAALQRGDRATLVGFARALGRMPRALGSRRSARRTARRTDREMLALVGPTAIETSARIRS